MQKKKNQNNCRTWGLNTCRYLSTSDLLVSEVTQFSSVTLQWDECKSATMKPLLVEEKQRFFYNVPSKMKVSCCIIFWLMQSFSRLLLSLRIITMFAVIFGEIKENLASKISFLHPWNLGSQFLINCLCQYDTCLTWRLLLGANSLEQA